MSPGRQKGRSAEAISWVGPLPNRQNATREEASWETILAEKLLYRVHKPRELPAVYAAITIHRLHAIGHIEPLLGPGESHIKLSCVLSITLLALVKEVRIAAIYGIKDNDIVKFQPLSLMNGGYIYPVGHAFAIAEVGLLGRVQLHDVVGELLNKQV